MRGRLLRVFDQVRIGVQRLGVQTDGQRLTVAVNDTTALRGQFDNLLALLFSSLLKLRRDHHLKIVSPPGDQ